MGKRMIVLRIMWTVMENKPPKLKRSVILQERPFKGSCCVIMQGAKNIPQ